jgi:hypothetical protein
MKEAAGHPVDLRRVMDAIPAPLFVLDGETVVLDRNRAAADFFDDPPLLAGRRLCGDAIRCLHAEKGCGSCGETAHCPECVIRQSVLAAHRGEPVVRQWTRMALNRKDGERPFCFLVTATPIETDQDRQILLLLEDVSELMALRTLIPICAQCGKVRTENKNWQSVGEYLRAHTPIDFSHGICPECLPMLYGETGAAVARDSEARNPAGT